MNSFTLGLLLFLSVLLNLYFVVGSVRRFFRTFHKANRYMNM